MMDQNTRDKIISVLTDYLGRAPLEREIQNAVTDVTIMYKVNQIINI